MSQAFNLRNIGRPTYEKELLAILMAIAKWKHYLQYYPFIIRTDHRSLKYLLDQKATTSLQQKGMSRLLGMNYSIQYKKGKENVVADALSRRVEYDKETETQLFAMTLSTPAWLQEISASYQGDTESLDLIALLSITPTAKPPYSLAKGVLKYKDKVVVGNEKELRIKLLQTFHDSAWGGHSGILGTYNRLKAIFFWRGMKADVYKYVSQCDVCQRCKGDQGHLLAYYNLCQYLIMLGKTSIWTSLKDCLSHKAMIYWLSLTDLLNMLIFWPYLIPIQLLELQTFSWNLYTNYIGALSQL